MSVSSRRLACIVLAVGVGLAAPTSAVGAACETATENDFCAKKEKPQKGKKIGKLKPLS